ncbi:CBF-domain-containing protein [Artomyces pyxidatus]|uniref:CBF-domain-containing protein n=1 Tax=Artomyces pyxidatus TaxID=48021 RepID=A0ACB8TF23_9AGAM|nr:CBF-domain-containing protein [Artomyces pyxidatus]
MAPSSLPPAAKRRKVSSSSNSKTEEKIRALETSINQAIAAKSSLNPLADLVELACTLDDPKTVLKAIYATYRVIVTIISEGRLEAQEKEEAKIVRQWITDRLNDYSEFLQSLLKDEESSLRTLSLNIQMSLLKHLSSSLSKTSSQPQFHVPYFKRIVHALLVCPQSLRTRKSGSSGRSDSGELDSEVRDLFVGSWLNVHDDVRWFFLRDAQPVLTESSPDTHPYVHVNLLSILERLTSFPATPTDIKTWWVDELRTKPARPKKQKRGAVSAEPQSDAESSNGEEDEDDWRKFFDEPDAGKSAQAAPPSVRLQKLSVHQSLHSLPSHRAVFTRLWLSLLPRLSVGGAGSALSTRALNVMHQGVMPHLTRAVMIMDWVGACVDYGGVVGMLALNTLFILMQEYNLDYPSFYTRLYAFLNKDLLHLKHRGRFFRLTEVFLSSTHLPATLLASFIKRLARLSLSAPPSSIVIMLPFVYNILKRHPALMVMIHRDDDDATGFNDDPFLPDETNPNLTCALDSSLWELYSHKHHYHSGVSTLARIFEEAFTKPSYPLEDFLDHTYSTLLDAELKRRIKKEPAVATELPKGLFSIASDDGSSGPVESMWSFA